MPVNHGPFVPSDHATVCFFYFGCIFSILGVPRENKWTVAAGEKEGGGVPPARDASVACQGRALFDQNSTKMSFDGGPFVPSDHKLVPRK